jgi:hAT family C-terminal dimerisation region
MMEQYPNVSQMALDILSIPATSCDCERAFSELGDMLAPRRSRMKPDVIAALQCNRSFNRNGFIRK